MTDELESAAPLEPWTNGIWHNEPQRHAFDREGLTVTTDPMTDLWRETYYGFVRDNGHFYGFDAPLMFTAQLRIRGAYEHLYDQAGIMLRADERHWIKAGVEFADGHAMLSSVVTDGSSDWATAPYAADPNDFWMRVTVASGAARIQYSSDGKVWSLARLAPLPGGLAYRVGPMCCTPERAGLCVRFSEWHLGAPLGKDLHDQT